MRYALFASLAFGGWPLLAKFARAPAAWSSFAVMAISTCVIMLAQRSELVQTVPNGYVFLVLTVAGLINGAGMIAYGSCLNGSSGPVSALLPVVYITMLAVAVMGGVVFSGEPLTWTKIAGTIAGIIAVYLFSR